MAASEVVISGILYHGKSGAGTPVTIVGIAGYSNLTIWGGPGPEQPPIAGGPPGSPTFPISGYPDFPYPSQPIYRPGYPGGAPPPNLPGLQPPTQPPENPSAPKPPPPEGGWGWHPEYGWGYFPMSGGKPQPPA